MVIEHLIDMNVSLDSPSNVKIPNLFFPNSIDVEETPLVSKSSSSDLVTSEKLLADFETARASITSVLDTSGNALERLMDLVRDTDSPRAFEVAATLMSTISTVSKDLLEIHERLEKLQHKTSNPVHQTNIQNNVVFKGTTKELLDEIQKTLKSST